MQLSAFYRLPSMRRTFHAHACRILCKYLFYVPKNAKVTILVLSYLPNMFRKVFTSLANYMNQRSEIYWVYLTGRRPARHPHDDVGRRLLRFVLDFGPATHKIGGATRASVIMSDARSAAAAVSERISF